ncbi:concanavalin A-like lectin/glucanase domain-containing protein [Sphaerosporella brunnea]|uniref:Concanavalin A-like lectin/glucanase domain-containing protein n=1 Tax=Sphaerosporella brunnea TaxID=1250544 RepID=A0A5J5EWD0_9PEZI|nr:concanavalin A-like lectin/glucanase domain-containing protein [Sphaerosporella brunnea]
MHPLLLVSLPFLVLPAPAHTACECGHLITSTNDFFTHRLLTRFTPPNTSTNSTLLATWEPQTWLVPGNLTQLTVSRRNEAANVFLSAGGLTLRQRGWDGKGPVSAAELHSIRDNFLFGSFRMRGVVRGGEGAVAGFFVYYDDSEESDVEIVTRDADGGRWVHYTNHPAYDPNTDTLTPNATFKDLLAKPWWEMQEHRLDWTAETTKFWQDGVLKRTISKNVPSHPGKVMINLWANNGSWSGQPSSIDVTLEIEYVDLYFNTSESNEGRDEAWNRACETAKGKKDAHCEVGAEGVSENRAAARSGGARIMKRVWTAVLGAGLVIGRWL